MTDDPGSASIGGRALLSLGLSRNGQSVGADRPRILIVVGYLLYASGLAAAVLLDWRWGWVLCLAALVVQCVGFLTRQRHSTTTTGTTTRP